MNIKKSTFFRIIGFLNKRKFMYVTGLCGMCLAGGSISVILAYISKELVNGAINKDLDLIKHAMFFIGISISALCVTAPFFYFYFMKAVRNTIFTISTQVYKKIQKLPVRQFENSHTGDLFSRMTNDIRVLDEAFSGHVLMLGIIFVSAIASFIAMLSINYRITLIMLGACLVLSLVNALYARPIRKISNNVQSFLAKLTERLSDLITGYFIIRIFQITKPIIHKFDQENNSVLKTSKKRAQKEAMLDGTNYLFSMLSFAGTIAVCVFMGLNNKADLGTLTMVVQLQSRITELFLQVGFFISIMQISLAGADRIFELLDREDEPSRYAITDKFAVKDIIEFKNISFSYHDKKIINNLDLAIKENTRVALVGKSGCGKSTIIKLLLGFYPPQTGQIYLDKKPMSAIHLTDLRNRIAFVPQDCYLFEGTIYRNIEFGKPGSAQEEIIRAAKAAFAHDFICQLANKYETQVGERGVKLSGGQKQRIAIARAFLKDAPVIVLDEPTSSLDTESEKQVQKALDALMADRTVLMVTHRLATIKACDIIYVLENGQIIAEGDHSKLLQKNEYYKMINKIEYQAQECVEIII